MGGDIAAIAKELTARGLVPARYNFLDQDPDGGWTAKGRDRVFWSWTPMGTRFRSRSTRDRQQTDELPHASARSVIGTLLEAW